MEILLKIAGAVGLLFITAGVIIQKPRSKAIVFIIGGLLLLSYSAYIRDPIFIPLQIIFTIAAIYELYRLRKK